MTWEEIIDIAVSLAFLYCTIYLVICGEIVLRSWYESFRSRGEEKRKRAVRDLYPDD